jgi:O-antigen ligase
MSSVGHLTSRPRQPRPAAWAALGLALAVALGLASAQSTKVAVALAVLAVVVGAVAVRPSALLVVLVVTLFVEAFSLGGLTVSRIVAPVALVVVVAEWVRGARPRIDAQLGWVAAYAVWALASLLWTADPARTADLLASLAIAITYMLAFATLLRGEREVRVGLWALAAASVAVGVLSLAGVASLGSPAEDLAAGRAQGGVGDPNFFAALQVVAFPLILVLASSVRDARARVALYAGAVVTLASALETLSRGGLIAMLVVLLLLPFLRARSLLGSRRQKAAVLLCVAAGALVVFSLPGFGGKVVARARTIVASSSAPGADDGSGRREIWRAARHAVGDRPVLGVGYGAFPAVSTGYLLSTPGVDTNAFVPRPIEVHSAFLGSLAEIGIVGLVLYLGLLLSTALALRRTALAAFRAGAPFVGRVANACLLALLGWAVASLFLESETARAVWILIGLSLALPALVPAPTPPRSTRASASRRRWD